MKQKIHPIVVVVLLFFLAVSVVPVYASNTIFRPLQAASTVTINASTVTYTIPDTLWSDNLAAWEGGAENGTNTTVNNIFIASGRKYYRWPGGSWGDTVAWNDMQCNGNTWIVSYQQTLDLLNTVGGKMQPIVNNSGYWCGVQHTQAEAVQLAADWVRDMNITRGLGVKYWEIGNEVFGSWEQGYTNGTGYAARYMAFYQAMKAVDPTIKIGAVSTNYDGTGTDMQDMLTILKTNGIIPDFLIVHDYPYYAMSYSPANTDILLGAGGVNKVALETAYLNTMVSQYLGSQYVGQVKYAFTEFSGETLAGGQSPMYFNAMFIAQDVMETAKNGWVVANPWHADLYTNVNDGPVRPTWYIYPLLVNNFGKNLVAASSSNSLVKAYASKDGSGNLTIFMVNNSSTDASAVQINISGFTAGTGGQQWLMLPAGADGSYAFERTDMSINGTVHPDPLTVKNMTGQAVTTGNSFSYNLPAAGMAIIKVPAGSGGATSTPTRTITPTTAPNTNTPTRTSTTGPTATRTRTPTAGVSLTPTRTSTVGTVVAATATKTSTPVTPVVATATKTITPPTPPTGGACSPVTSTITAPFTYDGTGAFCWQSSNLGSYINSWNTASLSINGTNYTNLYVASGSYPAKINGYWYVSYTSTVSYGHFEAK